jgi:hypothetical protein
MGYATAMWLSFGEVLAPIAGALTGLLFVAQSVNRDVFAASRSLSSRAGETLVLFMIAVLVAVAGLTFLLKAGGGLYWLIPAAVASLLGGVINTWQFLIRVTS